MQRRWGMLGLTGLVVAGFLTACAPSHPDLPLYIPNGAELCSDSDLARSGSVAVPLTNTGSTPITLSDASPSAVSQLDVTGSWIVPPVDDSPDPAVYAGDEDPGEEYVRWSARIEPDGAVIEAGQTQYLVVVASLPAGSDAGWMQGVTVSTASTSMTVADTGWGLTPGAASCPWSPPGGNPGPTPTG